MNIYHYYGGEYPIRGKIFPVGTVVLELDNGVILCCNKFNVPRSEKLSVYVYLPSKKRWGKSMLKNVYTEIMWDYFRKHKSKISPKKKISSSNIKSFTTRQVSLPRNAGWSMTHPFQGGGFSAR